MVQLSSWPVLSADCGTKVTLKCEVSSPELVRDVKHMEWSRDGASLCSVRDNQLVNPSHRQKHHLCLYTHGHLSLILHNVQPRDGGASAYECQLRSNRGVTRTDTRLEFKGQSIYLLS